MRVPLILLTLLIASATAGAQQLNLNHTRLIGGYGFEGCNDALYDERDKSIVFTGYTQDSCGTGDLPPCPPVHGKRDLLVGKMDSNRNLVWLKQYGGSQNETGNSIAITGDGGYVVLGSTASFDGDVTGNHGGADAWLLKLESNGNLEWQRCYGSSNGVEGGSNVVQTSDGGFILIGTSTGSGGDVPFQYVNSPFSFDWFVVKTDSQGNKQWAKTTGGTGDEEWASVFELRSGYYIAGFSGSHDHECDDDSWHPGVGTGYDYFLIRLDSAGNYLWNRSFGGSSGDHMRDAIFDERDSSFVMTGHTYSTDYMVPAAAGPRKDIWTIKVDLNGSLKWSKVFGDNSDESLAHVRKSPVDKGYIVSCRAQVNNPVPPYYFGLWDIRLFLIDSSGNLITDKTVGGSSYENQGIGLAGDKGFALAGETTSMQFAEGNTDAPSVQSQNAFVSYLHYWGVGLEETAKEDEEIKVYPNPAGGTITIELQDNKSMGVLTIMVASGREVWRRQIKRTQDRKISIDSTNWPRGMYLVNWQCDEGGTVSRKLVLQ